VLAAADAYHAMTENRPHRPAFLAGDAASRLLAEADAGRFRRGEVDAVLAAAGEPNRSARRAHVAGLTEREIDVLRLIARDLPNKQAAVRLHLSPKTVGRHVEHI
jgi:DNA-binding NarL/FixJ family response regulator